jgi:hypothetical protein
VGIGSISSLRFLIFVGSVTIGCTCEDSLMLIDLLDVGLEQCFVVFHAVLLARELGGMDD